MAQRFTDYSERRADTSLPGMTEAVLITVNVRQTIPGSGLLITVNV